MIQDALTLLAGSFSGNTVTGQSLAGASGTVNGTNVIDAGTGSPGLFSADGNLAAVVSVIQGLAGATSVAFQLVQADDVNLTANVEVLASSAPIPVANLGAGANIPLQTRGDGPSGVKRRYFALQSVIIGGPLTAGSITASLTDTVPDTVANLANTIYKANSLVL